MNRVFIVYWCGDIIAVFDSAEKAQAFKDSVESDPTKSGFMLADEIEEWEVR